MQKQLLPTSMSRIGEIVAGLNHLVPTQHRRLQLHLMQLAFCQLIGECDVRTSNCTNSLVLLSSTLSDSRDSKDTLDKAMKSNFGKHLLLTLRMQVEEGVRKLLQQIEQSYQKHRN